MKTIGDHIKPVLALLIIILGFTYYFVNLFNQTKPNDQILIAIVALTGQVVAYYFHTTKAENKDKQ